MCTVLIKPKKHRVHEACGPGAYFFALTLGANINGQVLWIRESWKSDTINPVGLSAYLNPDSLLTALARSQAEMLAVAEEALRSGCVSLVVAELSKGLDLTAGRRLQIAAKHGKTTGLMIIPQGMGSNTAETRWYCEPIFKPSDSTLQRWTLMKNKSGTLGAWNVRWDTAARRIIVVSSAIKRPGSSDTPH